MSTLTVEKEVERILSIPIQSIHTVSTVETNNISRERDIRHFITSTEYSNIVIEVPTNTVVVASGTPGPPGPPGAAAEEDMPYAKRVDFVSDSLIYRGEATVGSLTSDASWRIRKIVLALDNDISETWADGDANFDNIWDDRASLTYS